MAEGRAWRKQQAHRMTLAEAEAVETWGLPVTENRGMGSRGRAS